MASPQYLARRGLIPAHAGKTHASTPATRNLRAHPRSRGENALFSDFTRYVYGSSPLTRGKLSHQIKVALQVRLIPAHAGKTRTPTQIQRWRPVHPRSRGENTASFFGSVDTLGSSPLTRGKLNAAVEER